MKRGFFFISQGPYRNPKTTKFKLYSVKCSVLITRQYVLLKHIVVFMREYKHDDLVKWKNVFFEKPNSKLFYEVTFARLLIIWITRNKYTCLHTYIYIYISIYKLIMKKTLSLLVPTRHDKYYLRRNYFIFRTHFQW